MSNGVLGEELVDLETSSGARGTEAMAGALVFGIPVGKDDKGASVLNEQHKYPR